MKMDAEQALGTEITKTMLDEENKLHQKTEKEEENEKETVAQALSKENENLREVRFQRLEFLLKKSNMYTSYLLARIKQQDSEEKARQERRRKKLLKKQEKARKQREMMEKEARKKREANSQNEQSSQQEWKHLSVNNSGKASREASPVNSPSLRRKSLRTSTRNSPLLPVATEVSPNGNKENILTKTKKGRKRKADGSPQRLTSDLLQEAADRVKRHKEDVSDSQNTEASSQGSQAENPLIAVNCNVVEEEPVRTINGEVVHLSQPKLLSGGVLRHYQVEGYKWLRLLYENGINGILADEMGLGKTVQCIALVAHLIEHGIDGPFLVVVPLSTIPNWMSEFKRFTPLIPVILYHGSKSERASLRSKIGRRQSVIADKSSCPVIVTSYEVAMNDRKWICNHEWKLILVDEGHRLKNFQCRLIKELKVYRTTHRLLLTGTPLQNNLSELWSLLNFLLPEIFDDLSSFEMWIDVELLETSNEQVIEAERSQNIVTMLHNILNPFMLRRVKTDVELNLPPKREILVYAPMSVKQQEIYRSIVDRSIAKYVERETVIETPSLDEKGRPQRKVKNLRFTKEALQCLYSSSQESSSDSQEFDRWCQQAAATTSELDEVEERRQNFHFNVQLRNVMMILRKCTSHPYLIEYPLNADGSFKIDEELISASGKLMMLDCMLAELKARGHKSTPLNADGSFQIDEELISGKLMNLDCMLAELKARGHKVLLFSQMTKILDVLEDFCYLRRYNVCRLDGSMKIEDRREQIDSFNSDPEVFIFLLSTRAGGLGLNLTAADTCIIFDSDWNPQNDLQAQDRCHRIGQTRPVMVYRLVTAGTIDQRIVERAAAKRKLEKIVIQKGRFKDTSVERMTKKLGALSSEELLQLLQTTDYHRVVSDKTSAFLNKSVLDSLLDRSELHEQWRKSKNKAQEQTASEKQEKTETATEEVKNQDDLGIDEKALGALTSDSTEDPDVVFKVLNEDCTDALEIL